MIINDTFSISDVEENNFIIYRSKLLDAARCIIRGSKKDAKIIMAANNGIFKMFEGLFQIMTECKQIKMYALKRRVSEYILFKSIYQFRLFLIANQLTDSYGLILNMMDKYCSRNRIVLPRLNIILGYNSKAIFNTDTYFNNTYDKHWLNNELMKKIIKDIDKSEVVSPETINSPVLGQIPPMKLSGGVKTLMLIYNSPENIFNASTCGDNCARWIEYFSRNKNFVINLYHAMQFKEKKFSAYIVNSDKVIESMEELYINVDIYCRGQL